MNELASLFVKYVSDKERTHHYSSVYEWLFSDIRNKPGLRLLEIGVKRGASIRAWEDYFGTAEIVGVDFNKRCANIRFKRARVVVGDANDPRTFAGLGDFGIVIDDGFHLAAQQLASLKIL